MLFFIIPILLFILSVPYAIVGAKYTRNAHALRVHEHKILYSGSEAQRERIDECKISMKQMNHQAFCYLMYSSLKAEGCTCNHSKSWHWWNAELAKAQKGNYVAPEPKAHNIDILAWPFSMLNDYINGGEAKKYNPYLTAEMEKLAGIKELDL